MEWINGVIKTQLAKIIGSFNMPWPNILPLVFLNIISTAISKYQLSPFEIIT